MAANRATMFQCEGCQRLFQSVAAYMAHNCVDADSGGLTAIDVAEDDEVRILADTQAVTSDTPTTMSSQDSACWSRPATLLLIASYRSKDHLVKAGKLRKKQLWALVSEELGKKGHSYQPSQVESRWKVLMRGLKAVVDHNSKSGNDRKVHPYEEELDFVIAQQNVVMENILSSSPSSSTSSASASASSPPGKRSRGDTEASTPKRPRYTSPVSQVVDMMNTFMNATKERHQAEIERQNNMHEEKMALFASLIGQLKK